MTKDSGYIGLLKFLFLLIAVVAICWLLVSGRGTTSSAPAKPDTAARGFVVPPPPW